MKFYVNNVKVKLYLQLEKIYHTKKKRNANHLKLLSRKLELEMIKCIITYEYHKAIQNAAFEEYLIICENKFLIR